MHDGRMNPKTSAGALVGLLVLCFAVAGLGGLATAQGLDGWYDTLSKPPWNPPRWVFGPVWTVLYTVMAVAAWDVLRRDVRAARPAMMWFGLQLVLNLVWSPIFFAWHATGVALLVIGALWFTLLACIVTYWPRSRIAAGLMVPYIAWVTVASSLNAWVWWFNDAA